MVHVDKDLVPYLCKADHSQDNQVAAQFYYGHLKKIKKTSSEFNGDLIVKVGMVIQRFKKVRKALR